MDALNKKTIEDIDVKGKKFLLVATLTFRLKTAKSLMTRELLPLFLLSSI